MKTKRTILLAALACVCVNTVVGQALPGNDNLPGNHDPVAYKEGDTWYVFSTGRGVSMMSTKDFVTWTRPRPVLETIPTWPAELIPGFRGGSFWAPDIIKRGDTFYLYYSASAFGENTSAIGVATAKSLDPESPDYGWTDHGPVVQSVPGRDFWNAIDANVIIDEEGTPWMNFGSFWGGIMMVKLADDMLSVAQPEEWYALCRRERSFLLDITDPGDGAVEAPFIFKKGEWYYLFVSFDYCCRGLRSDYKVMVGRSKSVKGPYVDKNGMDLFKGGGSLVVQGEGAGNRMRPATWTAVGHCSVYNYDGRDLIFMHGYDARDNGASKLLIRQLDWDAEGWPTAKLLGD